MYCVPGGVFFFCAPSARYGGFGYESPLTEFRRFEEYGAPKLIPFADFTI
jgi:hypothetical protein